MPTEPTLLPPNATPLERALSQAMARIGQVPVPQRQLYSPQDCPADLLPWLAWSLSIDRWKAEWSEAQKRAEVARAIELQRLKGTPAALEELLADYDPLIRLVEWFETAPRGTPHTFQVIIPLDGTPSPRSTADFSLEIIRDIARIKPARSHYDLLLQFATDAALFLTGAGYAMTFQRTALNSAVADNAEVMLSEDGLAILTEDGELLEVG